VDKSLHPPLAVPSCRSLLPSHYLASIPFVNLAICDALRFVSRIPMPLRGFERVRIYKIRKIAGHCLVDR
jgi:hypothetical protein